jgi:hypothetical protein
MRFVMMLLGVAVLFSSCAEREVDSTGELARVGGRVVTREDFRYWWRLADLPDTLENRERVLEQIMGRLLYVEAAYDDGLDEEPEVKLAIENILSARVRQVQLEPLLSGVGPDESQIQEYYQAHREEKFRLPERIHAAVLWFDTRGQAPLEERYRVRLEGLREGWEGDPASLPAIQEGFGAAAIRNSEHRASIYRGGDVGWLQAGSGGVALDAWRQRVFTIASGLLEPGDLSQVTVEPEGVFLVRLMGRQPERFRNLDEVKPEIHQRLAAQMREDRRGEFERELREKFGAQSFPEVLRELSLTPPEAE